LQERYGPQHWWPADSPFEVMVGAILTQNTAWSNVERAILGLRQANLLHPQGLAEAEPARVAEYIRPAGYFNVKARRLQSFCRYLLETGGESALARLDTDALRHQLLAVHGVGPETADDILLYAFQRPVFVVDAYTRRLFGRLGLCATDVPYESLRLGVEQALRGGHALYNELHALIVRHAKEHCRKRPACGGCPVGSRCPQAIT
jgi:endonuclease III related protein